MAAKLLQSCPTLCNPIDGSPPVPPSLGFSRQEHWSGLPFPSPMHESEKLKVKSLNRARLPATPWTAAYQAPPSMGFSRQEYWNGLPLPSPYIHGEDLKMFTDCWKEPVVGFLGEVEKVKLWPPSLCRKDIEREF